MGTGMKKQKMEQMGLSFTAKEHKKNTGGKMFLIALTANVAAKEIRSKTPI